VKRDRDEYGTTGFFAGTWDLLHPGHLTALGMAHDECDWLMVGLNVNPCKDNPLKDAPVETVLERWARLNACKFVDEIIPYESEDDIEKFVRMYEVNVLFAGVDHPRGTITGEEYVVDGGGTVVQAHRDHDYSSSDLRDKVVFLNKMARA